MKNEKTYDYSSPKKETPDPRSNQGKGTYRGRQNFDDEGKYSAFVVSSSDTSAASAHRDLRRKEILHRSDELRRKAKQTKNRRTQYCGPLERSERG